MRDKPMISVGNEGEGLYLKYSGACYCVDHPRKGVISHGLRFAKDNPGTHRRQGFDRDDDCTGH